MGKLFSGGDEPNARRRCPRSVAAWFALKSRGSALWNVGQFHHVQVSTGWGKGGG